MVHRRTRPGRLATLDALVVAHDRALLERRDGPWADAAVVDVGLGMQPWTTLELAAALAERLPSPPPVLGVDIDPRLVAEAVAHGRPGVRFVQGDLGGDAPARLVRALNVLRDRSTGEVPAAHAALGASLLGGGVLVEGSCGPHGEVGVVHRIRRAADGLVREALWMWTDGTQGSAPLLFRDRLPRDLRGSAGREHPVGALLHDWMDAYRGCSGGGLARLHASVAAMGCPELVQIGEGAVAWTPSDGVPPGLVGRRAARR